MTDADRFHIPPQGELGKTNADVTLENQRAQLEAYQSKRVQLGEGMSPVEAAKQPVMAMSVIDIKPLISFFAAELQRARDQLAVERSATSSAREALAACEERARAMTDKAEEWRRQACELVSRNAKLAADREHAQSTIGEMAADMAKLRGELNDARPEPGSTAAVIEAYRLLTGHEPHWHIRGEWIDRADGARSSGNGHIDEAKCFLLYWLDEHAPGGRT